MNPRIANEPEPDHGVRMGVRAQRKRGKSNPGRRRPRRDVSLSQTLFAFLEDWAFKTKTSFSMATEVFCRKGIGAWYPQSEMDLDDFPWVVAMEQNVHAGGSGGGDGPWRQKWVPVAWTNGLDKRLTTRRNRRKGAKPKRSTRIAPKPARNARSKVRKPKTSSLLDKVREATKAARRST